MKDMDGQSLQPKQYACSSLFLNLKMEKEESRSRAVSWFIVDLEIELLT